MLKSDWLLLCVHTVAVSLGTSIVSLDTVQCQLNSNNASNLIITLVVGSQIAPSLDVFIAIMKLANALLDQGNTKVQVWTRGGFFLVRASLCPITRRHSYYSCANQMPRNSLVGSILTLKMQRLS